MLQKFEKIYSERKTFSQQQQKNGRAKELNIGKYGVLRVAEKLKKRVVRVAHSCSVLRVVPKCTSDQAYKLIIIYKSISNY